MFYKIIKNNQVIDVNNKFLKLQRKHNILVDTDYKHAEFICSSDESTIYTTSWTSEVQNNKNVQYVEAILINQDEYEQLKQQLELNHVEIEVTEDKQEIVEVIEPKEPQRHFEALSLWKLEKRVTELEKIIAELQKK